jgi:hypothetical protein
MESKSKLLDPHERGVWTTGVSAVFSANIYTTHTVLSLRVHADSG